MRYLRPAAALLHPDELAVDQVLLLDEERRIQAWMAPKDCPATAIIEEFPDEIWAAAPRLLHAHLESYDAPSADWPRSNFAEWAAALLQWRIEGQGCLSAENAAAASLRELHARGCGFVLASTSEQGAAQVHAPDGLVLESWPELFEPDPAQAEACMARFLTDFPKVRGVALHAPFSVSPELARLACDWASAPGRYLSIHLGEHEDERTLLAEHSGPLAELMRLRGRALPATRWESPVAWLEEVAPGRRFGMLAVHAGALCAAELRFLLRKGVDVVFCPGTHRYFDRSQPAFEEANMPAPLLGCDSRASVERLDPWLEVRAAAQLLPSYSGRDWWDALTRRAAAALGEDSEEGSLLPGRRARVVRLPDPGLRDPAALCDSLVSAEGPLPLASTGIPEPFHVDLP